MLQIDRNDIEDVLIDLDSIIDLLTVVEASEYYQKQDANVFHSIRNAVEFSKDKLVNIVENATEVEAFNMQDKK